MFADDTIAYMTITGKESAHKLQDDLNRLAEWEETWQMQFHPDKCQLLSITRNRKHTTQNTYVLHGHTLETVDAAKYLGITITSDINWGTHIDNVTKKGNMSLAFLRRNIRISSPNIKSIAYKALVRPQVEYASSVWDPHEADKIHQIEMVQRRSARWVYDRYLYTSSVQRMLDELKWKSLCVRREQARLTMLYKMVHGLVRVNLTNRLNQQQQTRTRRAHPLYFEVPQSATKYHQASFYPRTATAWNRLPLDVIQAPTVDAFRAMLA